MAYWLDCMSADNVIQFPVDLSGGEGHCFSPAGMVEVGYGHVLRIYPNPTPGRFTVEFPDPLLKDSYYSVYDAMGRLLYQRPLPTGATVEEVDLSRFGRGTYVLRVTDPEGQRHERVVVE
ncbi:MAG: T9SS type A sorting domain-containing protein [Flavobacteriales bacterium]|nr:T9SS type A sorting domain-containing protein [Flavobacteriales bacterium]